MVSISEQLPVRVILTHIKLLKENQFYEGGSRLTWILFFYKKNIQARIAKISAQLISASVAFIRFAACG
jgi:hypothetical protein